MNKAVNKLKEILCNSWYNDNVILSISRNLFTTTGISISGFDCEIDDESISIIDDNNQNIIIPIEDITDIEFFNEDYEDTITIMLKDDLEIILTKIMV